MNTAYAFQWEESERGWGVRPDGISLHTSEQDAKDFVDEHFNRYRGRYGDTVPDEYDRPSTEKPFQIEVLDKELYERLEKEKSVRLYRLKPGSIRRL